MKVPNKIIILATLAVLGGLMLSACGAGKLLATPTLGVGEIQTAAVSTFAVGLTQTALAMPMNTPTNTAIIPPTTTSTPPTPLATVPNATCYNLTGVRDVSIPDNTPMVPGQSFTKTWLVLNSGTCPWNVGFKFALTSGDAMHGTTLVLDKAVAPGAEIELSIAMTAPSDKTGAVRGNWHMSIANGTFFGDEQYVIIFLGVPSSTATTVTRTATSPAISTATSTASATPIPSETFTPTATP